MQKPKFDDNRHDRADQFKPTAEEIEKARAAKAKYAREYRRRHPEKNKQACLRYWIKKAQESAEAAPDTLSAK